jgi:hypothetical protein
VVAIRWRWRRADLECKTMNLNFRPKWFFPT